jgi:hypothetical protein
MRRILKEWKNGRYLPKWTCRITGYRGAIMRHRKRWLKNRQEILPHILWFRDLISQKLTDEVQKICLNEIDTILNFGYSDGSPYLNYQSPGERKAPPPKIRRMG